MTSSLLVTNVGIRSCRFWLFEKASEALGEMMQCYELDSGEGEIVDELFIGRDEVKRMGQPVELPINSVIGLTALGTMKLRGMFAQKEVVVLNDSGASHNFISAELVQQLRFPLTFTKSYGVIMGTGLTVKGEGICRGITLKLPGLSIAKDFLPIDLGSSNVILGMQVDWDTLTMTFNHSVTTVTLQGELSISKTSFSLKTMWKVFKEQGEGLLLELGNIVVDSTALHLNHQSSL